MGRRCTVDAGRGPIRSWRLKQAALGIRQADRHTAWRSGYIQSVQQLNSDGGQRAIDTPWAGVWLATQTLATGHSGN